MNHLLSSKLRNMLAMAVLLVGFLVAGTVSASAQTNAQGPTNPMAQKADLLGVTAYSFGTFDVNEVITATEATALPLKPKVVDGTATQYERFKYQYCQSILMDVRSYYVAPEIAALTCLDKAAVLTGNASGLTNFQQQMKAAYEEVTGAW